MTPALLNATVVKRTDITDDLMILGVRPDDGVKPFTPGQYVALALHGGAPRPEGFPEEPVAHDPAKLIKRAYSIGSSPHHTDYLEFYIAIVPTGALTSRLALIKEGDRIFCAPKIIGTFTLDHVPEGKNVIMVATGTGLAPFVSMVRTPACWEGGRNFTIAHGVRYQRDLAYRDELLNLSLENPRLKYHAIVSRDEPGNGVEKGYVQRFFTENVIPHEADKDHVFLCGNPAMITDIETLLTAKSYVVHSKKTPGNLHFEKYW